MKQQNPDVKLVVASGYIEPELKFYFNQAGIQHFIHKPYSPDEIVRTLRSLMEEGKILSEGSRQQPEQ
jgi:DNA-binding NarL/FixJ family response regulator